MDSIVLFLLPPAARRTAAPPSRAPPAARARALARSTDSTSIDSNVPLHEPPEVGGDVA
jgi:hypothetical protein